MFVELPHEDADCAIKCAQLLRRMYGTGGAADGWQEEHPTMLMALGFVQGESCPNVVWHQAKDICCSVHGDAFTSSAACPALDWLEEGIAEHYEITIQPRMGPGPGDAKEGRSLNRVVRWLDGRIGYEAGPRQSERFISECGLNGSKGVATPGVKPTFTELRQTPSYLPSFTLRPEGPQLEATISQ